MTPNLRFYRRRWNKEKVRNNTDLFLSNSNTVQWNCKYILILKLVFKLKLRNVSYITVDDDSVSDESSHRALSPCSQLSSELSSNAGDEFPQERKLKRLDFTKGKFILHYIHSYVQLTLVWEI